MTEVWTNEEESYILTIKAKGTVITREFDSPITKEIIMSITSELGIANYTVYDEDDEPISKSEFPVSYNVVVKEYNAPKSIA